MIAVCGRGSGIDNALDIRVSGGDQHIERTVDTVPVGFQRIGDATRHRRQCRLVDHIVRAAETSLQRIEVGDAANSDRQVAAQGLQIVEMRQFAGQQVVDGVYLMTVAQKALGNMRADETGGAGHYIANWHGLPPSSAAANITVRLALRKLKRA